MKQYPKLYEDIYSKTSKRVRIEEIGSTLESREVFINQFKLFYHEAHRQIFDIIVKQIWLEKQFTYKGLRRKKRVSNGFDMDAAFSFFLRVMVGVSQKPITVNHTFSTVSTYLIDLFPEFLQHNPFTEPEYFKYPFENLTLDHFIFVYQLRDLRLDMLKYANNKKMPCDEFINWVSNYIFCMNDELGEERYLISSIDGLMQYINDTALPHRWIDEMFNYK